MHIAVTGVGIVSALGVGKKVTLDALRTGRSGIVAAPTHFATRNRLPVGEVALDNAQLQQLLGLSGCHSRTALLGILAASEALQDAGASRPRTALVSATSVGGMDLTEQFFPQFMQDDRSGRLRQVVHHDCADSTISIARYCGIDGFVTTISTACSSAANALMLAVRLLRHGVADRVVAGGTDSLCRFTLNGFKSLMILDSAPCRPFDESRAGLNLGEGAAYLVLERAEDAAGEPYCFLDGFANANDAFHQTASSADGEGDYLAMRGALEMAGITPEQVDYINVHGTGTPNNDLSEGVAMQRLFSERIPAFGSTKPFTGHTLAAAGGIEAAFCVLALRHGELYPHLHFARQDPQLGLTPQLHYEQRPLQYLLSNSFGFGGNCASLLFAGKIDQR